MGFFRGLGEAAKYVGKGLLEDVKQKQEERDRAYAEGQCMTDEELVRKFKSASGMRKVGFAMVLEERGYLEKDNDGRYRRTSKTL